MKVSYAETSIGIGTIRIAFQHSVQSTDRWLILFLGIVSLSEP